MDNNIGVGIFVGLVTASSLYVWNSESFTKNQKIYLLCCIIFFPLQWVSILVILAYNNYKIENSPEKLAEKKSEEVKTKLDSTIDNLRDLKQKGILTDEEYSQKVEKLEAEKTEQDLKNSTEYKQLKSLFDSGVLTKDEFESKVDKLKNIEPKAVNEEEVLKINSEINKTYIQNYSINKEEEITNEIQNTEKSKFIYVLPVLLLILIPLLIFLVSNNSESRIEEPYIVPMVETTPIEENNNSGIYNSTYENNNKKTFVYVKLSISKPVLRGFKSSSYEIKSYCYVEYEESIYQTDIIELDEYNEDVKYQLLDKAEKNFKDSKLILNNNLYSEAVYEYGYEAAEIVKNANYSIKINSSEVLVFDSYAEASKSKR